MVYFWMHISSHLYARRLLMRFNSKMLRRIDPLFMHHVPRAPISRNSKGDKHRYFCRNTGFVTPGRSSTKYLSLKATSALDQITRMHFSRAIERANTSPE